MEFVGKLKKLGDDDNATDEGSDHFIFVVTILGKITKTRLEFSQGSVTVL